jgi:predicted Fe-Mo cluster-binding NifX family protein
VVAVKVAVSTLGSVLDDPVDERFGRTDHLLIVDCDTLRAECIDNAANRDALQGAGIGAAELVANSGAEAVITGHLGPKAYRALSMVGIEGYSGVGMTVREAVRAFEEGTLGRLAESEPQKGLE